jgi:hypothetical protein
MKAARLLTHQRKIDRHQKLSTNCIERRLSAERSKLAMLYFMNQSYSVEHLAPRRAPIGGTVNKFAARIEHEVERSWISLQESGTNLKFAQAGPDGWPSARPAWLDRRQ